MNAADRLLAFEVAETLYALPIDGVIEVAEGGRISCVPTLPRASAGIMNWHGDALPVIAPGLIFDGEGATTLEKEHVIVVSDRGGDTAQLGIPIDRVVGLVDGAMRRRPATPAGELIVERRRVRGRVVSVLDPCQLVARAEAAIDQAAT